MSKGSPSFHQTGLSNKVGVEQQTVLDPPLPVDCHVLGVESVGSRKCRHDFLLKIMGFPDSHKKNLLKTTTMKLLRPCAFEVIFSWGSIGEDGRQTGAGRVMGSLEGLRDSKKSRSKASFDL